MTHRSLRSFARRALIGWPLGLLLVACGDDTAGDAVARNAATPVDERVRDADGNVSAADDGIGIAAVAGGAPSGSASDAASDAPANDDAASAAPVVTTASGPLRGVASGGLEQFLGVPYAAPPLGPLRFAPPAAPEPWTEVRDASQVGSICLQPTGAGAEDCLTLNVYRPAQRDPSAALPVMVWIHGGSFVIGAGSGYDPRRLVEENGIVVVTLNYRLGVLGFMAHPALTAESPEGLSGDYGLMDQQAALRWVRDNIAAFGGDPAQVTIQGQSAGGASVCAQLASPPAAGLFARAVIQSASCASAPLALAEAQGTALASALGCGDAASVAECLRALPANALAAAATGALFGPIVGGEFLPEAPFAVVLEGAQHPVPVLVGGVSDEMRGFFALEYPLDPANYRDRLATYFPAYPTDAIEAQYPLDAFPEAFLALSAALSDSGAYLSGSLGGCVTSLLADTLSASTPTFAYELDDPGFTWAAGAVPVPVPRGASHSSDLAFLFEPVGFVLSEPFDAGQTALAEQIVSAWGAFIESGDPSTPALAWPGYDTSERRMLHLEPGAVGVTTDFRARHRCAFWEELASDAAAAAP